MKLRYWTLMIASALLTCWALSHIVRPVWAVVAALWVSSAVGFAGMVATSVSEVPPERAHEGLTSAPPGKVVQPEDHSGLNP